MNSRFTRDGSPALEQHLADVCELVREGICAIVPNAKLEGIALAGGYGRGEGGVLRTEEGDQPYNDLEFFVFIRGSTLLNDRRYKAALYELGERLTPAAGIEVEFKIISSAILRRAKPSMFYYDLVMGHRWLNGDDSLLENTEHHRDASRIPLYEVTRLLFNRCSGLLFAKARLQQGSFTPDDADFVARNIAKAQLALGDALLAAQGRYHWSCIERHQRLEADEALHRHHAQGVAFKLHPQRSTLSREGLTKLHTEVSSLAKDLFLRLESQRLGHPFPSASDYASGKINKCPEQPAWKNILQHLRTPHVALGIPQPIERHPREALLHALVVMLWINATIQRDRVQAYESLWHRFN
jgi:hypothetical protein